MRRILAIACIAVACIALLLFACRGPLSLQVLERGFARNLKADFIGELDDGLHVVLCGAGGPLPDRDRTGPCVAEVAEAAGVGHLLYYHVVPPLPIPGLASVFLDGADETYSGGITLGVNGTMVSLPAGSDAIELGSR